MIFYTLTIFLSAFLLFQVQPMIGRHILPWFGGGPGVWSACMLFFQVFLLLGYSYAHLVNSRLPARGQAGVHLGVLLLSLFFASIAPGPEWRPSGDESPVLQILLLLTATVGIPFATLASTSPLMARWFSRVWPSRHPYRLYALSNAGSLLALLSYPFVVEPTLALGVQERFWSIGYAAFVVLCGLSSLSFLRGVPATTSARDPESENSQPDRKNTWLWLALAATGSVLLLATTNEICQDLAVIPMLWVLPLAIYLLSFIICFDHERWYNRGVFIPLFAAMAAIIPWIMHGGVTRWPQIVVFAVVLFAGTMVCHGELFRAKPALQNLTRFYLVVAAGGAMGGIIVSILAPLLFSGYWEYPLALLATGFLAMICLHRTPPSKDALNANVAKWMQRIAAPLVASCVVSGFAYHAAVDYPGTIETTRTFFGVTRIANEASDRGPLRVLRHGRIVHGQQYTDEDKRNEPIAYFGIDSGVGIALARYRALLDDPGRSLRVGLVGLGAGTISAHGRPGDVFRFYEIDPEVERVSRKYFTYLENSAAGIEIVSGDARVSLEREVESGSQNFDLIILDAFAGDAIPIHLITREAYQIFRFHLRPNGLIVFHVTNHYLDLSGVIRSLAEETGGGAVRIALSADEWLGDFDSEYVITTDDREFLEDRAVTLAATDWLEDDPEPLIWTDDSASLWDVIRLEYFDNRWSTAPTLGHFVVDRADLISAEDQAHLKILCQGIYSDTDGAAVIVIRTTDRKAAVRASQKEFENFTAGLFHQLEIGRLEITRGLLLFISSGERRAAIHVGKEWPTGLRQRAHALVRETVIAGFKQGQPSEGILEFVEALDPLIRQSLAAQ